MACISACSGSSLEDRAKCYNCPTTSSSDCTTNAAGQTNWAAVIVPLVLAVVLVYMYWKTIKGLCWRENEVAVEPEAPPQPQPQASSVKHIYAPAAAAPPPPQYAPAAPPTWDPVLDPGSGRTYYVNSATHETSWARPLPAALSLRAAPPPPPPPPAPALWTAHADPMGRTYFANAQTGETRWERPSTPQ